MAQTPDHYKSTKYHCIEVMSDIGLDRDFYLGNAFKYLWRCLSHKDSTETNIVKCKHYLDMWLERNKQQQNG